MEGKKLRSLPEELSSSWTDLHQAAGQPFAFHHRRGRGQFVSLRQPTGDPGGGRALPRGDDDAHAVVTTSSHGATPGVYHEADQEPAESKRKGHRGQLQMSARKNGEERS